MTWPIRPVSVSTTQCAFLRKQLLDGGTRSCGARGAGQSPSAPLPTMPSLSPSHPHSPPPPSPKPSCTHKVVIMMQTRTRSRPTPSDTSSTGPRRSLWPAAAEAAVREVAEPECAVNQSSVAGAVPPMPSPQAGRAGSTRLGMVAWATGPPWRAGCRQHVPKSESAPKLIPPELCARAGSRRVPASFFHLFQLFFPFFF